MTLPSTQQFLQALFQNGVSAARAGDLLAAKSSVEGDIWRYRDGEAVLDVPLTTSGNGRIIVAGAGKAAASMARGLEAVLGDRIASGAVIVKTGHSVTLDRIAVAEASHPIPGEDGVVATKALQRLLGQARAEDTVFFLLSGGASALLVGPAPGLRWSDKALVSEQLIRSASSIAEINTVRKHISSVKGGRLRAAVTCRAFCTLAISDVPGDHPAVIGSGPTVLDPSTFDEALAILGRHGLDKTVPTAVMDHLRRGAAGLEGETPKAWDFKSQQSLYQVLASNRLSIAAVVDAARARGYDVRVISQAMEGNTHQAARVFAAALKAARENFRPDAKPIVLVAGGETTLTVRGQGRGGRNQEFAVVAAQILHGCEGTTLLSAGTDGTDGPTDAAGAIVDGETCRRAQALGFDVDQSLRENNVYPMLDAVGALYRTGPTGTNVMDLVIGVAARDHPNAR